jgi:Glycosyl hydrolase family 20, catalytic domain
MALGGLVLYVLSSIVYQPIDSKETAKMLMSQQRGGPSSQHVVPHHKPGDKHSPLMLLREREQARREQQEKQKQQLEQENMDDHKKDHRKRAGAHVAKETGEVNEGDAKHSSPGETDEGEGDDKYNAEDTEGNNDGNGEEDQGGDVVEDNGREGEGGTEEDEKDEISEMVEDSTRRAGAGAGAKAAELLQAVGADIERRKPLLKEVMDQRQKQLDAQEHRQADEQPIPQMIVDQQTLLEQLTNELNVADRDRILLEIQQGQGRIASYMHEHVKDPDEQQRWTMAFLNVQHRLHPHLVRQQQDKQREGQSGQNPPKLLQLEDATDKEPNNVARGVQLEGADQASPASNETASSAQGNATKPKEKKIPPKKKQRKLPKMDHNADSAGPIEGDPLRASAWPFEYKKIDMKPSVDYLGTLIDGGRHYFSIEWLKRAVDRLADMNYNLIHLRLTDDQTFNILLKSRPQLAYPQAVDNPERKVWTVDEMRDLTAYAKSKGVSIMPEINVPGHAGSWYGIPDMVVHCPRFICERGYGLPLNVTHKDIKPILTDVIKEVASIFDDPPFLHLGGDEVNMADDCFHEVGSERFDYPDFERVLKDIIKDSGYPEDRIVRWEMTGQANLDRAGAIEHFWESHPGDRHNARGKFFVSTWMYLDTNAQQNAFDVFEKANINFQRGGALPTAIIVGTFELSEQFWYDRNVLGRLLSVAIGANNPTLPNDRNEKAKAVTELWIRHCEMLGLGDIICETEGT